MHQFGDAISYFNFLNTNILIALYYEMAILVISLSYLMTKVTFNLMSKISKLGRNDHLATCFNTKLPRIRPITGGVCI